MLRPGLLLVLRPGLLLVSLRLLRLCLLPCVERVDVVRSEAAERQAEGRRTRSLARGTGDREDRRAFDLPGSCHGYGGHSRGGGFQSGDGGQRPGTFARREGRSVALTTPGRCDRIANHRRWLWHDAGDRGDAAASARIHGQGQLSCRREAGRARRPGAPRRHGREVARRVIGMGWDGMG